MAVSVFDLFKIGIGPSSSHTVGPMKAACTFARRLESRGLLEKTSRIRTTLYGSLAHTGRGHGTGKAVMLGLQGAMPDQIDPDSIDAVLEVIRSSDELLLTGSHAIRFREKEDLLFNKRRVLPHHPNGMRFEAMDAAGSVLENCDYYSVGGGFVVNQDKVEQDRIVTDKTVLPYPFSTADELLAQCEHHGLRISGLMMANEQTWRSQEEICQGLAEIRGAMRGCMERGYRQQGVLPGGLKVERRAPQLYRELREQAGSEDRLAVLDWVNLFALSVNEENAAGGRVVTAPTNGAAGVVPAVIQYYLDFIPGSNDEGIIEFLLTAGAIGILYLQNASISGAEVGCQGEVGVACSMAAGGLTAAMGGKLFQVENAAEIGMEHNLGLTCDPVGGLVQIPCIERNAMAAVKAINAQRLAFRGDGKHQV